MEEVALRGLRLADVVERVAADFEAAGQGPDLMGVLLPEVAGDLGGLAAAPVDAGVASANLASLPIELPLTPVEIPDQSPGELAGDFLGGLRDELTGTLDGLVHAALHPADTIRGLLGMVEHPGDTFLAMLDWGDLENDRPGRWVGHMLPGALLGLGTGGAGFFIRVLRIVHRVARDAEALEETVGTLAREIGERDARLVVTSLGRRTTDEMLRAMMPAEIRRFVDTFGAARVGELLERYTAQSLAYYGVEFFEEFRGVTDETMRHVMMGDGIEKGKIKGCHDRDAFVAMIRGNGEIVNEIRDAADPQISIIRYKLYKRRPDGTIEQPPQLQAGKLKEKTVIRGFDPQRWRRLAEEATARAIRRRYLPKDGDAFQAAADDGTMLNLYYRPPMIDSFFPVVR